MLSGGGSFGTTSRLALYGKRDGPSFLIRARPKLSSISREVHELDEFALRYRPPNVRGPTRAGGPR